MLVFPNAKINLGLTVTEKRSDGYHNIETVFYPVSWCDALEILDNDNNEFQLSSSGLTVQGKTTDNLLYKVWTEIKKHRNLPNIKIHLHKVIPMGAGLGGGSSDAAFLINALDKKYKLALEPDLKTAISSKIGSDCAFFLENKPVSAFEKGDRFSPASIDLSDYYILIVYPGIHSNTAAAYSGIVPGAKEFTPAEIITRYRISEWKNVLENDFEKSIFKKYPRIRDLKQELYNYGALYASMSGSGSSVFGIYAKEPSFTFPEEYIYFLQTPVK